MMRNLCNFIKVTPEVEKYRCSHCFIIDQKIAKLTCPCQKYICQQCIKERYNCQYCCQNIEAQWPGNISFQYQCLSNSPHCNIVLPSRKSLIEHCAKECAYIDKNLKKKLKHMIYYECQKGHRLQISNNWNKCNICKSHQYIRKSTCMTCLNEAHQKHPEKIYIQDSQSGQNGYCVQCRPIPCTKTKCPHDHDLVKMNSRTSTCDLCGGSVRRYPAPAYYDRECDFDICSFCYRELPEEHPLLPIDKVRLVHKSLM